MTIGTGCPIIWGIKTNKQIIDLWPSYQDLADEIDEKPETVRKWRQRDSIPSSKWFRILQSAKSRGYPVTGDILISIKNDTSEKQVKEAAE